jgi:hypothetical protein
MNKQLARTLIEINNEFYSNNNDSFSASRVAPWNGWQRCLDFLSITGFFDIQYYSVFDLACGNLRFENYLNSALPDANIRFYAADNCSKLVPESSVVNYQNLDVLGALLDGQSINALFNAPICDLSVCFGFMHHVPSQEYRAKILYSLIDQTCSDGFVAVSFWQFMNNQNLAKKAQHTHRQAMQELNLPQLDNNDYLLGWKDIPGTYRYCHSFSEAEIDQLIDLIAHKAKVVSSFISDGRTNNLNRYLILKAI